MPYRYKLYVDSGFLGGDYEKIIESDTCLTEDQVQDMAEQYLEECISYGGVRVDENDEEIDFDAPEDETFEDEEEEDE